MTREQLLACTKKTLAELARKQGIVGWRGMRKAELILALEKRILENRSLENLPATPQPPSTPQIKKRQRLQQKILALSQSTPDSPQKQQKQQLKQATQKIQASQKPQTAQTSQKPQHSQKPVPLQMAAARNTLGTEHDVESSKYEVGVPREPQTRVQRGLPVGYGKDRIVLLVRDPYWLHTYWELTHQSLQRAEAALAQEWHGAQPILRLLDVSSRESSNSETILRDISIHGGCNNWYIDVDQPPRSFRVDIGYLARSGRFYVLARSNVVTTPRAGVCDTLDENWADLDPAQADRLYAMSGGFDPSLSSMALKQLFEERLRRPLGSPTITSFGSSSLLPGGKSRQFWFQLDADLIIYGATEPNARITLQGQPVQLRDDGTFTVRFKLPDTRQIIPAVATSPDGCEERTIVLAIERNTKRLEPIVLEENQ